MPKSKRNKVVSLTKTRAKGRPLKTKLVEELRNACDEYKHIYVFSFQNLRAGIFKDIRQHFRESRIFMGKNKIAQIALGRSPEDEFKDNLHHLSTKLEGDAGLFFTNRDKEEIITYFNDFTSPECAKSGAIIEETIILSPGPLKFPATMLDQLRKLGLVVEIDDTVIYLREPFTAATSGVPLTPEQAKVLTHMERKTVNFSIKMLCNWSDGSFGEL
mmetsp:Transcript_31056/g.29654  ORF Transcript_31056/g.29654 Transcript_31056/m.29654 type:complete len:216 (-) Transcript_31056:1167-1814(-)